MAIPTTIINKGDLISSVFNTNPSQQNDQWLYTPNAEPRGYIKPHALTELWFHTGTRCNLSCDFCLEGSSPSDKRLQAPKLSEVVPFIDEALSLGVEQFSFTGGEPFLIKDIINILDYASKFHPCLVLSNGTEPLMKRLPELIKLNAKKQHPVSIRISLDAPNAEDHNLGRGKNSFEQALVGLKALHQQGFTISVARHMKKNEDSVREEKKYRDLFALNGLPADMNIVAFPDFLPPGSLPNVPHITTSCMTRYQTEQQRKNYMCATSKMVIKKEQQMQVYACTLVDDDDDYFLAKTLTQSMTEKISMKHHRCYSCFAFGASCSEK